MLERAGTKAVRIAYDRDEAGNRAAEELGAKLNAKGIETYRVLFPKGMDANAYAKAVTPATQSLGLALRKAEWMGKGTPPGPVDAAAPEVAERSAPDSAIETAGAEDAAAETGAELDALAEANDASPERKREQRTRAISFFSRPLSLPCWSGGGGRRPRDPVAGVARAAGDRQRAAGGDTSGARRGGLRFRRSPMAGAGPRQEPVLRADARERRAWHGRAEASSSTRQICTRRSIAPPSRGKPPGSSGWRRRAEARSGGGPLGLEKRQEEQIESALKPKASAVTMTESEREEAIALLRDPRLLERIARGFRSVRRGGRGDEQAGRLPGGGQSRSSRSRWRW